MKLKEKIRIIMVTKTVDESIKEIIKIIRLYENELVRANALLEAVEELSDGIEVSDFMLSFPVVRKVADLIDCLTESKD